MEHNVTRNPATFTFRPAGHQALRYLLALLLLTGVASAAQAGPTLTVFDCGSLQSDDISTFGLSNDATDVRELFVPCYLVRHEKGLLLWDFGLPTEIAGAGRVDLQPGSSMRYETSLITQLKRMKLGPGDITYIAPSHMHFDHVGAINKFPESTLLIARAEYAAAFERADENTFYDPSLYSEIAANPRLLLDGDHDVFGDGSVIIVPAPGHTAGHQMLLVKLEETGPIMLSGDLYHFEASRELQAVPEFNSDPEQTRATMKLIEARIEKEGATLWIEHNMALAKSLQLAPAAYK